MATGAVLLNFGPGVWNKVKQAVERKPQTPQEWAKETFGVDDPIAAVYGREFSARVGITSWENRTFLLYKLRECRRYFVDVDGSGKDGTLNRVNPAKLPMWLRIAFLPDFVGINQGATEYFAFSHYDWPHAVEFMNRKFKMGDYNIPETGFNYDYVGKLTDMRRFSNAYPLIRALLGFDVSFLPVADGSVSLRVCGPGDPPGGWLGEPHAPAVPADASAAADLASAPGALPYQPLPFVAAAHPAGHVADGWLYFGDQFLDASAGGHWLKIDDLNHTLVMGTSGFGKSVFLNQVLQGVRHNLRRFDRVLLVDLKGGVELYPYQALGAQFRVVYRLDDLPQLVAGLVGEIEGRLEKMRGLGARMWPGPKTLLVVDEYAQIQLAPEGSKEERQRKQELLANLNKVSMLGRAAGVIIWAQLQKGTTDVMDSSFRANLSNQVCFKVPNKLTAAGMFGSTDELLVDPVKLPKGRFVLFDASTGGTYYLQARMPGELAP